MWNLILLGSLLHWISFAVRVHCSYIAVLMTFTGNIDLTPCLHGWVVLKYLCTVANNDADLSLRHKQIPTLETLAQGWSIATTGFINLSISVCNCASDFSMSKYIFSSVTLIKTIKRQCRILTQGISYSDSRSARNDWHWPLGQNNSCFRFVSPPVSLLKWQ